MRYLHREAGHTALFLSIVLLMPLLYQ